MPADSGFQPGVQLQRRGRTRCRRDPHGLDGNSSGAAITPDAFDPDHPEAFVRRIVDGDDAAFRAIYLATAEGVFNAALKVLQDRQQAEDVTQDVFLYLWDHADRYDAGRGRLQSWLRVIAHHRAVDQVRSQQRRREREFRSDPLEDEAFELDLVGAIAAGVLRQTLARLTPDHRTVLLLAYFGGYSHSEIAGVLNTPIGTIKTRIRDAKIRLRRHLERHPCTRGLFEQEGDGRAVAMTHAVEPIAERVEQNRGGLRIVADPEPSWALQDSLAASPSGLPR